MITELNARMVGKICGGSVASLIKKTLFAAFCVVAGSLCQGARCVAQDEAAEQTQKETVRFRAISNNEYASFPVNWLAEHRYRVGLLRDKSEYEKVFNAAAYAGNKKPFGPGADQFKKETIVFVSRVIPAVSDIDKELRLERVVASGGILEVYFVYRDSSKASTYQVKATAAAWIPRKEYSLVRFFEGKKLVKELELSDESSVFPE